MNVILVLKLYLACHACHQCQGKWSGSGSGNENGNGNGNSSSAVGAALRSMERWMSVGGDAVVRERCARAGIRWAGSALTALLHPCLCAGTVTPALWSLLAPSARSPARSCVPGS